MTVQLYLGDCLDVLKTLPDGSVDAVVTDPPAGIAFMGKAWDKDCGGRDRWVEMLAARLAEARRVCKPGAYALVWALPRTSHWTALALEEAGWVIRDRVSHLFGQGFPKSKSCLKPAVEDWWLAWSPVKRVPPLPGLDACRIPSGSDYFDLNVTQGSEDRIYGGGNGLRSKPTKFAPGGRDQWEELRNRAFLSAAIAALSETLTEQGFSLCTAGGFAEQTRNGKAKDCLAGISRMDIGCCDGTIAETTSTCSSIGEYGRMPTGQSQTDIASIIEMVSGPTIDWKTWNSCQSPNTSLCTRENISAAMKTLRLAESKQKPTAQGSVPGRWPANITHDGSPEVMEGFAAFGESSSKAGPRGGSSPCPMDWGNGRKDGHIVKGHTDSGSAARFFYCAKASRADREEDNHHPTVKPTELMRWLCRLITPPVGTVLDPFAGSGSTGKAAMMERFSFVGIEQDAEYLEIARRRIDAALAKTPLFAGLEES